MFKKVLKWIGIVLGGLLGLLVVAFVVLYFVGSVKADQSYDIPVESISIPSDAASIERGKHMATVMICTRCHLEDLRGDLYFTIPGMLTIPTSNLTSGAGGVGGSYTDQDWVRAIRHGVGQDGRALFLMSTANQYLSADDLGAIIAYMKSLPPVDNQLPERRIEAIGRVMMAIGMMPPAAVEVIDHTSPIPERVEPGVSVAYGEYLTRTCTECHGAELNGAPFGPPGQQVPSPNLTPGGELSGWSEQDFIDTLRTGVTPSGHQLSKDMPWKYYGQMTDDELKAVWLYLQSLQALAQGG